MGAPPAFLVSWKKGIRKVHPSGAGDQARGALIDQKTILLKEMLFSCAFAFFYIRLPEPEFNISIEWLSRPSGKSLPDFFEKPVGLVATTQ